MTKIEITGDIKDKKFHFIAIGGIGMSGLAKYLIEAGCEVSGSDIEKSKYLDVNDYDMENKIYKYLVEVRGCSKENIMNILISKFR